MADASTPGRAATIVGFDVGETDWPLKASFVLFIRNVVEQARAHRSQGTTGPVHTGEPLRIAVARDVTSVKVDGPNMKDVEIGVKGGFAIVPPAMRAGVYHARWTSPRFGNVSMSVNLTSEKESDIRPKVVNFDGMATGSGNIRLTDPHKEWGLWLALIAALLVALDIFWITRTPRQVKSEMKPKAPGTPPIETKAEGSTSPLLGNKGAA
jgi:hypothetical protein